MRIPSELIPQANTFEYVAAVPEIVGSGGTTDQDIADAIQMRRRQGRYYRKAAEIIGLIKNVQNHAYLTELGRQYLDAPEEEKQQILISAVLNARIFQRVFLFLEQQEGGVTKDQLTQFIINVTQEAGPTMIPRRVSTITSWLSNLGLIREHGNRYLLPTDLTDTIEPIGFNNIEEPLLPDVSNLSEYEVVEDIAHRSSSSITQMVDQARVERALSAHQRLVNITSQRIRNAGFIPRYNQLIDLATRINADEFIFEMKSITEDNIRSQIRSGVSQLYEYRYLQNKPSANLILVIEYPLPPSTVWMLEYLESDRDIHLLWDGEDELYCSEFTGRQLEFLNPIY